ncbi:Ig-like domain-containing protein [Paraglaciecola aquimarina]|uniref:Ig-like domain-containing protein n=1 Tax=Paraglaciecola algarum TaxID=3050085 RepID=A0ABS9D1B7_9ALTE|nr:Ig-like domain-containing protein [Paraglaciecola sp. G1-23]MCF2946692.1 Ig-like domain-containing protein [Paraglaciecola sp. G1-23]
MILRVKTLLGIFILFGLFACGGGGGGLERDNGTSGNTGGGATDPTVSTIQLELSSLATGQVSSILSEDNSLRLTATVKDASGNAMPQALVTFTFNREGLAIFSNDSGSAPTNSEGVATIDILVGQDSGGVEVSASLSSGDPVSIAFTSSGTTTGGTANRISLTFTNIETGEESDSLSEGTPLRLTTLATDASGTPITDTLINYTFEPEGLAIFSNDSGTAKTNNEGVAIIDILVGDDSGAGKIIATLETGESESTTFVSAGITQINEQPASLDLFSSSIQLASSGSDKIELLALVKDANNVLLQGIEVTFSADSDASLQQTQIVTGADGIAKALLSTQNKPENRTITASVSVGTLYKEIEIQVVGTEVVVNGPPSVILGQSAEFTVFLANSDGVGIGNQTVLLSSLNNNQLDQTELVTDAEGQVTVTLTADNSGLDLITASAINAIGSLSISVQQDSFSFTDVSEEDVPLGQISDIDLTWLKENIPFAGGNISFTTTRGELSSSSVVTNSEGVATIQIQSSNAGKALISAQGEDSDGNIVNARTQVEFVATEVDNIIVSASSSSIGPSGQKSTITAILRDPAGNLVKGKTVSFNADDVSGGDIFPAEAVTDSNGLASAVFTSNTVTNEDGITITVTESESKLSASTKLTIADRAQFISIGTGNEIEAPDETSYLKKFTVFVTDANSNPVSNVNLTITGTPVKYTELLEPNAEVGDVNYQVIRPAFYKGYWRAFPDVDSFQYWVAVQTFGCSNEDIDGDAILDSNEDTNGNNNLTPGNIISIDGNVTTDENGQAVIELRYAKTFAAWGQVKITASTPVSGSESKTSQFYVLGASAADLRIESTPPNTNPFGSGVNLVEDPDNLGNFIDDGANRTCTNAL